jgi:hypothetical protein
VEELDFIRAALALLIEDRREKPADEGADVEILLPGSSE